MNSECREYEQQIGSFIENGLTGIELSRFLSHVEKCRNCYAEMETRYLISEALNRLEEGESIDLKNELSFKIKTAKRSLGFQFIAGMIRTSSELVAIFYLLFCALDIFMKYMGI